MVVGLVIGVVVVERTDEIFRVLIRSGVDVRALFLRAGRKGS